LEIELVSFVMIMIYMGVLALAILAVRHVAIKKRYYVGLKQFIEAGTAAVKAQSVRSQTALEKLEIEDKSCAFVRAELEDCVVTSRVPSGSTVLIVAPDFMSFLLPSILASTSGSLAQPDEFLILLVFCPILLFFFVSVILFAVNTHSLRRLESVYDRGSTPPYGLAASRVSVAGTTRLASGCSEWIARLGFFAAFFFIFPISIVPIQGIYSLVGFALVGSVLLLSEVSVIMRKHACIQILSKFPK